MEKIIEHFKEWKWVWLIAIFVVIPYKMCEEGYWEPTPEEIAQQKEEKRINNINYTKSCITRGLWVYPKQSNYFASFDFNSDGTWEMNNLRMGNSYKGTWSVTAPYEVEITYTYSSRGRGTIPDNKKIELGYGGCKDIVLGDYDDDASFVGTTYYRLGTF